MRVCHLKGFAEWCIYTMKATVRIDAYSSIIPFFNCPVSTSSLYLAWLKQNLVWSLAFEAYSWGLNFNISLCSVLRCFSAHPWSKE